jgi:hypothetical protein
MLIEWPYVVTVINSYTYNGDEQLINTNCSVSPVYKWDKKKKYFVQTKSALALSNLDKNFCEKTNKNDV